MVRTPWLVNITGDNEATYTRDQIKYIEFVGDLYIVNPEYWFAGLENLISADLTHMKIELAGSLEGLFGTLPTELPDGATEWPGIFGKNDARQGQGLHEPELRYGSAGMEQLLQRGR